MVRRLTRHVHRTLCVACVTVLLTSCATQSPTPTRSVPPPAPPKTAPAKPVPQPSPPRPAPQATTPALPVPRQAPAPPPSVTLALQAQAQTAVAARDFPKAIAILERAIRIEPSRPELWIALARAHLDEGDAAQAEQFARKALLFTRNNYDLEQQAWVVIADARAANH